jgi:hypothetical protein
MRAQALKASRYCVSAGPVGDEQVYKTAVFKMHNPSQTKRAMLKDSMKRAHLAYTRLLAHLLPASRKLANMHGCPRALGKNPTRTRE